MFFQKLFKVSLLIAGLSLVVIKLALGYRGNQTLDLSSFSGSVLIVDQAH